jgi:hypothetical protein
MIVLAQIVSGFLGYHNARLQDQGPQLRRFAFFRL